MNGFNNGYHGLMNGFYAVGVMHDVVSTPWSNDANKLNHKIVLANPFVDSNGFKQTEVINVDLSFEDVDRVKALLSCLKGERVLVHCNVLAKKGGRNGAWLSRFMIKGSDIRPLIDPDEIEGSNG